MTAYQIRVKQQPQWLSHSDYPTVINSNPKNNSYFSNANESDETKHLN